MFVSEFSLFWINKKYIWAYSTTDSRLCITFCWTSIKFMLAHFSNLFIPLWKTDFSSSLLTASHNFLSSVILCGVYPIPFSRLLIGTLNEHPWMTPQWEYLVPWTFLCPVSLSVPFLCYAPVLTDCPGRLRDLGGYTENQTAERSKKAQSPSKFSASDVASSLSAAILHFPQIFFCYTDTAVSLVAPHIHH